jgi:hypothetical protein
MAGVKKLVSAWLDRDGAAVSELYRARLIDRARMASESAAAITA